MSDTIQYKQVPAMILGMEPEQGIVEHVVAVMGNRDEGGDIIWPGAFTKTIMERGGKIKCLDNHKTDSVLDVLGKPLEMREIGREEMPADVLERYPSVTGGLRVKTQFLLNTPEGRGAFERIKTGAVDEWSIGYKALDYDYTPESDGKFCRNLRTIKLYEYGPVLWGMNPATATLGAKAMDTKAVMKTEGDGEHPASHYLVVEDPQMPSTWHLRVRGLDGQPDRRLMGAAWAALHGGYRGNRYEGPGKAEAIRKLTELYDAEGAETPKAGRVFSARNAERIFAAMNMLSEALSEAGLLEPPMDDEPEEEMNAPEKAASNPAEQKGAGPQNAPTDSDLLAIIQIEKERLSLLEV